MFKMYAPIAVIQVSSYKSVTDCMAFLSDSEHDCLGRCSLA